MLAAKLSGPMRSCHAAAIRNARLLAEGGYETRGLYRSGEGFFDPRAQDVVVDTVRALAQKAGRAVPP